METYDLGIIGAGMAGAFALLRIAQEHKNINTILFELGRSPLKRRHQICGWLGCAPNSDGKLFLTDKNNVASLSSQAKLERAEEWLFNVLNKVADTSTTKDIALSTKTTAKVKKSGFRIQKNDYIQLYPKDIHNLSKYMAEQISDLDHVSLSFDNEVLKIDKQKKQFVVYSSDHEPVICKKVLVCVGRGGWRWAKQLFDSFNLKYNNNYTKFGIRIEASAELMRDFNGSNSSLHKENLEVGPFGWEGTIIPEDHTDFAMSAFRSNEPRWKTDKVSFNLMGAHYFHNSGTEQASRLGQLTFILTNERVIKEKISTLLGNKSKVSIIPEYNWLSDAIKQLEPIMPDVLENGYYHIPTLMPMAPKIKLSKYFESDIDGLYVAGETAGAVGLLGSALSGLIALEGMLK